jgi:hypothetical protein
MRHVSHEQPHHVVTAKPSRFTLRGSRDSEVRDDYDRVATVGVHSVFDIETLGRFLHHVAGARPATLRPVMTRASAGETGAFQRHSRGEYPRARDMSRAGSRRRFGKRC